MTSDQHETRQESGPTAWPGMAGLGPVHLYVRLVAVALLLLVTGLAGGMVLERYVLADDSSSDVAFPDLEAVSGVIDENYYYRPTDPEEQARLDQQMEEQAIIGALGSLDDEYTRYLGPDQSQTAQEDLEGRYGGVGVDIAMSNDLVVVTNVVPESPADEAGIVHGDVIEMIDDVRVDVSDFDGIVRDLRGEIGSWVTMSLVRPSSGEVFDIELEREEIVVPPVSLRMIEGTSIGWLRISIFGDETVNEVNDAISELHEDGATGIVLDLRGNSGGWVTSAQGVLGQFLDPDEGPALYEDTTPGRGGEEAMPILATEETVRTDLPVVVLVDRGTASAAEIVAGALKDYDRAIVIGERTFGKGSVQRIFAFSDGATMRVTVAEWFTPSRGRIQQEGIRPNIEVTAGDTSMTGGDPVLDAAVRLIETGTTRPTDLIDAPATPGIDPSASPAA